MGILRWTPPSSIHSFFSPDRNHPEKLEKLAEQCIGIDLAMIIRLDHVEQRFGREITVAVMAHIFRC